jgi:hypothetical protein
MRKILVLSLIIYCQTTWAQKAEKEQWEHIFNGKNLKNWTVKIFHHQVNDNYANTFRVKNKSIQVRYDQYEAFNTRFGHLYYNKPLSYYKLKLNYRFNGNWRTDAPSYAKLNSGVMFHAQDPHTMPQEQDWPISVEFQFLASLGDGKERPTGNMCSPGTEIVYQGKLYNGHCLTATGPTLPTQQWVQAELLVLGDSLISHRINGQKVLQYTKPHIGGGVANGYDKAVKIDGKALTSGYIALQSEGSEVDFKNIQLLNLEGCMDTKAKNYKKYYEKHQASACKY